VFFQQMRAGQFGAPFRMLKFRTMTNRKNERGELLSDELRLTTFGKLLRKTSLDELPELYNVVVNDMSLVGPRPLHVVYNERYSAEQKIRLQAKPGITGWAQINGRNAISWDRKFEYDVWYVENQSLWLDITILLRTIFAVFRSSGINQAGHATAEEFMGSQQ
jgi:sugar transferase EpsL